MSSCVVMGGLGQVGSALVRVLSKANKVYVLDQGGRPDVGAVDFLHVAIPFSHDFTDFVRSEISYYSPRHVVVHSTVPVGTTRGLGLNAAHSPVRGQHNDLARALTRFVKYVGAADAGTLRAVLRHLRGSGIKAEAMESPEATEMSKLLCLSRYLNDLAFQETAWQLCNKYGVTPKSIRDWTRTYNAGYKGTKWVRPDLDFPMGKVGGHCVRPVSEMLAKQANNSFLRRNMEVFK